MRDAGGTIRVDAGTLRGPVHVDLVVLLLIYSLSISTATSMCLPYGGKAILQRAIGK